MPHTRPYEISNRIRLRYKFAALVFRRGLIAEDGAVDAAIAGEIMTDELAPDEEGIAVPYSEHNLFTGADKELALAPIFIVMGTVVALVHGQTGRIAIFRESPERLNKTLLALPIQEPPP